MIRRLVGLARERRGVGAVEFAVAAPFLILLYVGGYQLMDAISAYRKVTTATRTMADLTTRQREVTKDQVEAIMEASKQIMAPYSTRGAVMRITQITFDKKGRPNVDWSVSSGGTPMKKKDLDRNKKRCDEKKGSGGPGGGGPGPKGGPGKKKKDRIDIPCDISVPDTFVIYSEFSYPYDPVVGDGLVGPISFSDQLFMNPRRSNEVKCVRPDDDDDDKGKGPRKC